MIGFEDVFKTMDAIANAISDSCEPAIIPNIMLQTVDGKTVIVVEISEGRGSVPIISKPLAGKVAYMSVLPELPALPTNT